MTTFLHALAITGYQGIAKTQRLTGLSSFNFFIGHNNAGKSSVLNLVSRHLPASRGRRSRVELKPLERNLQSGGTGPRLGIGLPTSKVIERVAANLPEVSFGQRTRGDVECFVKQISGGTDIVWFSSELPSSGDFAIDVATDAFARPDGLLRGAVQRLAQMATNNPHDHFEQQAQRLVTYVRQLQDLSMPEANVIPAMRRVGMAGEEFNDLSGTGLIDRLAQLQNPTVDRLDDKVVFRRINEFVQEVTGHADAQINIPHDRQHIYVEIQGRMLPLENLGTGIQQVVMIAAFCTLRNEQIVCIEEPELHLHPTLQRKLVVYLRERTTNQYFIATHSAAFIDTPGASIFHVRIEDGATRITSARLDSERYSICADLGHRASDIVQTNAVIWVEGPSDRLYVKHWIRAVDDTLLEGTHYSVMFYGGRLLSHLSADDQEIGDFIRLRDLNRNLAIIMDSDKFSPRARINATKSRICEAFEAGRGMAWVTSGREIENYVPRDMLRRAVADVYAGRCFAPANGGGRFDRALEFELIAQAGRRRGRSATVGLQVDKVKVARKVCEWPADLGELDLRERLGRLVSMIRNANHL